MSKSPTTEQLRAAIDRGQACDKVSADDPAMAPLGTDDEAAGHPPDDTRRTMAAAQEFRRPPAPRRRYGAGVWFYAAFIVLLGITLAVSIYSASGAG